jgi:hypothetical protein
MEYRAASHLGSRAEQRDLFVALAPFGTKIKTPTL